MATTAGALTELAVTARTSSLVSAAATGGATTPYTYQWYRSVTSGFTPGGGNILTGKTSLSLSDTGLTPGTTYYYKLIAMDSSATPVAGSSTQEAVTTTAEVPSPNQFAQGPYLGMTDLKLNFNTLSVMLDPSVSSNTLVAGQAVKWASGASYIPLVVPCTAAADVCIGFVNYNIKNTVFAPGDAVEISRYGNVIYLYAALAVSRGQLLSSLPAEAAGGCIGGVIPVPGSGAVPIVGEALDTAAVGALFRVAVKAGLGMVGAT